MQHDVNGSALVRTVVISSSYYLYNTIHTKVLQISQWLLAGMSQHIWYIYNYVKCHCSEVMLQRLWLSSYHHVSSFFS